MTKKEKDISNSEQPADELRVNATPEKLSGVYSNLARVSHDTRHEFIIDFLFTAGDNKNVQLASRIITNPVHMKKLSQAIINNLEKFEGKHGEIKVD
jgi:dTDP-4-dehydrorhamnose reductase